MEPEAIDICPHGQQHEVLQGLVGPEHGRVRYSDRAKFITPRNEGMDRDGRKPLSWFFYLCFPTTIVAASVEWTDAKIR